MDLFRELIMEHYHSPQNWGDLALSDVTHVGNNPLCGDTITLHLKMKHDKLVDLRYTAQGCALSIASASLLSEEVKGRGVNELLNYSSEDVLRLLGMKLTPSRLKCGLLPLETLKEVLHKYVSEKA